MQKSIHVLTISKDALVLSVLGSIFMASPAHAYIDPGSGSVIVTTILGLFAAIGYTFRKYFYKIRRKITGSGASSEGEDSGN